MPRLQGTLALTPELIDRDELSQMHGPYIPGLSGIAGVNAGVYRWRQLSSRSPIGVIGEGAEARFHVFPYKALDGKPPEIVRLDYRWADVK